MDTLHHESSPQYKMCVEWESTNTSWHIGVKFFFAHTQSVNLKHNGIWGWGIYGLDGMGHLWFKWAGHYGLNRWAFMA